MKERDPERCRTCGHAILLMCQKGTGYCRPSCVGREYQ